VQDPHQPLGLRVARANVVTELPLDLFAAGANLFTELPLHLFASCADLLPDCREFVVHPGSKLHNPRLHPIHPFGKLLQVRHASLQPFYPLFNRLHRHQQHSGGPLFGGVHRWPLEWRLARYVPDDDTIVVFDRAC
jgi:hypothetical protein